MKKISLIVCSVLALTGCLSQDTAKIEDKGGLYYSRIGATKYTVVQVGETLSSIARKYGVSEDSILKANKISNTTDVVAGRTLAIPMNAREVVNNVERTSKEVGYKPVHSLNEGATNESQSGYFYSKKKTVTQTEYADDKSITAKQPEASNDDGDEIVVETKLQDSTPKKPVILSPSVEPEKEIDSIDSIENSSEESRISIQKSFKTPSPLNSSKFDWPLNGEVLAHFGKNGNKFNDGINIAAPLGSSVVASAGGKVIHIGKNVEGYGNLLIIKHEDNIMTAYAHMKEILVEKAVNVRRGEAIGTVGQSGNVSAPQLHFSVRKGKKTIDPEQPIK